MFLPNINSTQLQYLSASLLEKFENLTQTQLFSAFESLSGLPAHPYERMKIQLFGKDFKFPTIHDVEVPKNFCLRTCQEAIDNEQQRIINTTTQQVSCLSCVPLSGLDLDPDKTSLKKAILATEFGQTITVDIINKNPIEVAQKIVTFMTNLIKQEL